jgi:hypothetical protein
MNKAKKRVSRPEILTDKQKERSFDKFKRAILFIQLLSITQLLERLFNV